MGELQQLLADDFGGKKTLGLVRQVVGWIERLARREPIDDGALEPIDVVAGRRRDRHDFRKAPELAVQLHDRQQLRLLDEVDLVQDQQERRTSVLHQVEHEAVALPRRLRHVHDEAEHIDLANRVDRGVDHPHVHPVQRAVDARRVEVHHLGIGVVSDPQNPRPRRLGLVGHDGELAADQAVQQRRFPRIRPADEGHESELHR